MPRVFVHFAVAGAIDFQEASEALGGRLHDRVGIVEAAQLIVQVQQEFLALLRLVDFLLDAFPLGDVLEDAEEMRGLAVLVIDGAALHLHPDDASVRLDEAVLDVEMRLRL